MRASLAAGVCAATRALLRAQRLRPALDAVVAALVDAGAATAASIELRSSGARPTFESTAGDRAALVAGAASWVASIGAEGTDDGALTIVAAGDAPWTAVERARIAALADDIATTVRRLADEATLHEIDRRNRLLTEQMRDGFAYCRVVLDAERPVDFEYLHVNPAFGRLTGLRDVVGRRVSEIIPTFLDDDRELFEVYARVAQTGASETVERFVRSLSMWFAISVYRPEPGHFVAVFDVITARKEAEQALRTSVARLATVFRATAAAIVVVRLRDGCLLEVNAGFERMFGWSAAEAVGRTSLDLGIYASLADRTRIHAGVAVDGGTRESAVRCRRRSGEEFECTASIEREVVEGEECAIAFVVDVSDLRRAETALEERNAELRTMFAVAPVGIASAEIATGRFLKVNERLAAITGYTVEELEQRTVDDVTHPDDRAGLGAQIDALVRGEMRDFHREKRFVRKDGGVVWASVNVALLRDASGAPLRTIATIEDVTAAKLAADRLRASDDRYRTLVDNLDSPIFSTDAAGRMTFVSRGFSKFGYCLDDVVGRSRDEFIHPDDLARVRAARPVGANADAWNPIEYRLVGKSGKVHFVRSHARPLFANGVVVGATGSITDLTPQRSAEDQLRAAQKMEAIGLLAGGVAHDFNNLLGVILSYAELVRADLRAGDPLGGDVDEIVSAARRAATLTRQLLAFSRRQVLQPEAIDLGELLGAMANMLRRVIGEDVALDVSVGTGVGDTRADRGQLEQVVMNLVVNARDAMPEGGRLTLATGNVEADVAIASGLDPAKGGFVELRVADTGIGMDDATRARIFEPFFTTKGIGKGTGLGLSTVFGIVAQSGGAILVDSALGKGTTFRVLLPRETKPRAAALEGKRSASSSRGRECVLLVEDEPALRTVVRRSLVAAGYEVLAADGARMALELCARDGHRVQLVLTDMVMPEMSGHELAGRLRPLCPSAKLLFMTGYSDEAIARHAVANTSVLRKPFDRDTLTERVRSCLDGA